MHFNKSSMCYLHLPLSSLKCCVCCQMMTPAARRVRQRLKWQLVWACFVLLYGLVTFTMQYPADEPSSKLVSTFNHQYLMLRLLSFPMVPFVVQPSNMALFIATAGRALWEKFSNHCHTSEVSPSEICVNMLCM